jgi:hypothetical protein
MRKFRPLAAVFAPLPLTDRVTFYHDVRASVYYGIFSGLATPLVSVVGRRLGMGSGHFAFLNAAMAAGFLLNLWVGHIAERGDKAAQVFWPSVAARAAVILAAFTSGPVGFMLVFSFYNFASALPGPAYTAIMRSNYSEANRGRLMGDIRVEIMLVSAAAAAVAGVFLKAFPAGYRLVFPVAAAFGLAGALIFYRIKPRRPAGAARPDAAPATAKPSFAASVRTVAADKPFLAYMALFFCIGFPDKIVIPLEPIRLVDDLKLDYAAAGLIQGTIPFIAGTLSFLFYSRALKRIDPFKLLLLSIVLLSTRYLGMAVATEPAQLIPGAFIAALGNAGWDLLPMFTIVRFSGPAKLPLYMGVHMALIGIRSLVGPVLGSVLYESFGLSLPLLYWIVFGLELAGAAALAVFLKRLGRFPAGAPGADGAY